jgi:hypothetical protein
VAEDCVWSGWNCVLTEVVVALLIAKGCDPGVERSQHCRVYKRGGMLLREL